MSAKDEITAGFTALADTTELSVACEPVDYSASAIARAVEDCDAHLLNLNVDPNRDESGLMKISLKVNRLNSAPIVRSLERYGYRVTGVSDSGGDIDDGLRQRALEVLHYLEV